MAIEIKSPKEIEAMRVVGRMAAETLCLVGDKIRAGMTCDEINTIVHEDTLRRGGEPAPLHYRGFPKSVCTSVNDVVCHGIPNSYVLKEGDIVNVDVTTIYKDFHGDTSATFYIGMPSWEVMHVTEVARKALQIGIEQVREGARFGDIGAAIQEYVEAQGCSVVRDYVGHGIGRQFHEDAPQVKHYGKYGTGERIKAGMTFTIEPMVNVGRFETVLDPVDKWTVRTADGSLSAQFEHTLVAKVDGYEILTRRPRILCSSEGVVTAY
ncbi:type I methionyl aminopeptidase [Pajaroellobacter abortibovis]|uniref:Methionine aminopeptidase n=1 Tax=Pajaroellobacter abortibovis TaxID=1882918 RepID=A0A1L6MWW9_9BACT|nr:type I methionyl aminopeptidase [Pajaroellobacter abortibovis]APS00037.1 type I methionyl aminopeptidase [Pajaroellobacter abortibovis]